MKKEDVDTSSKSNQAQIRVFQEKIEEEEVVLEEEVEIYLIR